jgi:DNA-binding NtrC family response regulator
MEDSSTPASVSLDVSVSFNPGDRSYREIKDEAVTKFEVAFISQLLARHKGNLSAAAKEVRMDRKHLHDMAKKYGLR